MDKEHFIPPTDGWVSYSPTQTGGTAFAPQSVAAHLEPSWVQACIHAHHHCYFVSSSKSLFFFLSSYYYCYFVTKMNCKWPFIPTLNKPPPQKKKNERTNKQTNRKLRETKTPNLKSCSSNRKKYFGYTKQQVNIKIMVLPKQANKHTNKPWWCTIIILGILFSYGHRHHPNTQHGTLLPLVVCDSKKLWVVGAPKIAFNNQPMNQWTYQPTNEWMNQPIHVAAARLHCAACYFVLSVGLGEGLWFSSPSRTRLQVTPTNRKKYE